MNSAWQSDFDDDDSDYQLTERLDFHIVLSGTFWEKAPLFSILLDGKLILQDFAGSSEPKCFKFTAEVEENKDHKLEVRLENKKDSDTVLNADNSIAKDLLLNIHNIGIKNLWLDNKILESSKFIPDDSNRAITKGCRNLGCNGSYEVNFKSPYLIWLYDNAIDIDYRLRVENSDD